MKIAVAYEDGKVFQHFGHTENFKVYTIENNEVVSDEIIPTEGSGHGALSSFLSGQGVDVVICGGLGQGAQDALTEAGIQVVSGAQGDADIAMVAFLNGQLTSDGVNCDHHDHEEGQGCGAGGCSGCGGGCSGCGEPAAPQLLYEGPNAGKTCKVHYRGTFNDGTQFDASYDRGEPLEFVCAIGMMIPGFDKAVVNMEVGQEIDIHLTEDEAYGPADPEAIFPVEIAELEGAEELEVGDEAILYNIYNQPFKVKVVAKDETNITFDANHEMAGKELNFHIELVEVSA